MSARVVNRITNNEFHPYHLYRSPMTFGPTKPTPAAKAQVRKNLFGTFDHGESLSFIKSEIAKEEENKKELYGFDFVAGRPLTKTNNRSQYLWEEVINKSPHVYTVTTAAHIRDQQQQQSLLRDNNLMNILLDERAERQIIIDNNNDNVTIDNTITNDNKETVMTQTIPPPSTTTSTTISSSNEEKQQKTIISRRIRVERQPKITDFLKEKKRLATSSVKKITSSPSPKKRKTMLTRQTHS